VDKVWLKSYPDGIPAELPPAPYRSVRELFEQAFNAWPDRPSYTNMGTTLTYRDLDELSMQFACYLQHDLGLMRGERVAIMLPNILQYPVAMCGAFRAGLVVVNVNPMYTARELEHQLKDSGARCIVILENFAHTLDEVIDETSVEHVITTGLGDLLDFPRGGLTNLVMRYVKKAVPKYSLPGHVRFRDALKAGANQGLKHVEIGFADIAFLQYTGGTTGVSKGAMLSHRNMIRNVQQTVLWQGDAYDEFPYIIAITALPLYHIFSLEGNCLTVMSLGGENILITNPRDSKGFVAELKRHRFNLFTGVNTMFASLPAVAADWEAATGKTILQGYGLTETSPVAIVVPLDSEFTGAIGLPVPSTDVMICDDDGNALPLNEVGEICIKGPQVMEGYRLCLHRGPQEGHDSRVRVQRVPERDRERRRRDGWRTGSCCDRHRGRALG
jgi:long-chain acyl-CoA synthetase